MPHIRTIALDEADRLLSGENVQSILDIIKSAPKQRQLIYTSASRHPESMKTISTLSPDLVFAAENDKAVNPRIKHLYMKCEERDKPEVIRKMLRALAPSRAIVFVHKSETAEIVADKLEHHKISVADLHGLSHKEDRKRSIEDFKNGKVNVLIASDVAARGLDIKGVTHVFNLDAPTESDAYLHRVGRTARAGAEGIAVSLIVGPQSKAIQRWKKELGIEMTEVYLKEGRVLNVEDADK